MSYGIQFQMFVEELRGIGFPVDKVTGGDIDKVFKRKLDIPNAVIALYRISEDRKRFKQSLNRTVG
jgi:hypothetical protein